MSAKKIVSTEFTEFSDALKKVQNVMRKLHPDGQSVQLYVQYTPKRIELRLWPDGEYILTYFCEDKKRLFKFSPESKSIKAFQKDLHKNPEIKKFFENWVKSLKQPRIPDGKNIASILSAL